MENNRPINRMHETEPSDKDAIQILMRCVIPNTVQAIHCQYTWGEKLPYSIVFTHLHGTVTEWKYLTQDAMLDEFIQVRASFK